MLKKNISKIICILIAALLMFNLSTISIFATNNIQTVTGTVINADDDLSCDYVSDIQINVYSMTQVFSDSNQIDFSKEFEFSIYSNQNGEFSFTKPTENCIVEINENTVADGYGVLVGTDLLGANDTVSELSISEIDSYEVDIEENLLDFFNADNKKLTVKDNINPNAISDITLRIGADEDVSVCSTDVPESVGTSITYENEVKYTKGFFTYHYEYGMLTESELRAFYTQFNHTKNSLCNVLGFQEPPLEVGESTYHVYFGRHIGDDGAGGMTWPGNGDNTSRIAIRISGLTNLDVSAPNYEQQHTAAMKSILEAISHEFMHAIQRGYVVFETGAPKTFCEGVCSLTQVALVNYSVLGWPHHFQQSPELSLFDNGSNNSDYIYREYCPFFAAYLYEHYSQFNVIKKVYEESVDEHNIYLAIDNVLREHYNSSFLEAYLDFRVCAYDMKNNTSIEELFNYIVPTNANSPKKTAITEDVTYYTTPMLSTIYFEYEAEAEDYYTFYFALQGTTTACQVNLTSIYTSPTGDVTVTTLPFNTSLKMANVDMEEGSTICFLMSNINITDTNIQFYTCM